MASVSLVSLGCPKNLVDSECSLGAIAGAGHELVTDADRADVVVVSTCAFIESARQESVEAILEALGRKKSGKCRAVIVAGCLSQRCGADLIGAEPEIDAVLGIEHPETIAEVLASVLAGERTVNAPRPPGKWIEHARRVQSTPPWTAYLKVSDGCDNRCAYCAIPDIRGAFRSRPEKLVIDEARRLADQGVRELVLVGQDLTAYGADLGVSDALAGLLERLAGIEQLRWIRLMYCYPTKVTRRLIDLVASCDKVVDYIDLPLQHGDDRILRAMNRRCTSGDYLRLIDEIRDACPRIALRSSFIVGFPGETEAAFEQLMAFVERIDFDRVGVFAYSREEGTPAAGLKLRVSRKTAEARRDRLMRAQQAISLARNRAFVGKTMEVLVEGSYEEGMFGRSYRDAPEIDGLVYLPGCTAKPGQFAAATIAEATEYDLIARRENT